jgi:serpin B
LLSELTAALQATTVDLALPKLKMRSNFGLRTPLETLGMVQAFYEGSADFSGIGPAQNYIQEVLHEAFVGIDEQGTEAGAATAVVFGNESAGPVPDVQFHADRPFLLVLEDIGSETVLFAGRYAQPE